MSGDSLSVGTSLPPVVRATSTVQIFRYSAATWNTHRIHYDQAYAQAEGYPGVLVQSHLHGAFLAQYCTDWAGPDGRLTALSLRVRRFAVAGEELTISGVITAVSEAREGRVVIEVELTATRGSDGEVCAPATASLELPASRLAS
jgi:hydroxyacyl-ACP dehydratase HTD2-like protein with hotdog domain